MEMSKNGYYEYILNQLSEREILYIENLVEDRIKGIIYKENLESGKCSFSEAKLGSMKDELKQFISAMIYNKKVK